MRTRPFFRGFIREWMDATKKSVSKFWRDWFGNYRKSYHTHFYATKFVSCRAQSGIIETLYIWYSLRGRVVIIISQVFDFILSKYYSKIPWEQDIGGPTNTGYLEWIFNVSSTYTFQYYVIIGKSSKNCPV